MSSYIVFLVVRFLCFLIPSLRVKCLLCVHLKGSTREGEGQGRDTHSHRFSLPPFVCEVGLFFFPSTEI